jgi:hypothetical protein
MKPSLAGLAAALPALVIGSALVGGVPPAAVAVTEAATGDSIVYLEGGQVWIARADGTGARPFTVAPYGWRSPSEDAQGNVVVLGGLQQDRSDGTSAGASSEIYRFGPDGNQIGTPIPTWGTYSTPACPTLPPDSARVSPDGTRVAYDIFECATATETTLWTPVTATGLQFPGQTLGQADFGQPQWIDSSQFLVSHVGPTVTDTQARWFVHRTTDADDTGPGGWYDDRVTGTGAEGIISPTGTTLAVFSDDAADWLDGEPRNVELFLYSAPSLSWAESNGWSLDCTVALDASSTTRPHRLSPSFSSDGGRLYWGDDAGVEVAQVADRSSGCANVDPQLLIPGGSEPFVSSGGVGTPDPSPDQPGAPSAATPHAAFTVSPARPRARTKVVFDGSASYETGGQVASYSWRFGDGHTATGVRPTHRFASAGYYRVRLVVTDADGARASTSQRIHVRP